MFSHVFRWGAIGQMTLGPVPCMGLIAHRLDMPYVHMPSLCPSTLRHNAAAQPWLEHQLPGETVAQGVHDLQTNVPCSTYKVELMLPA